ncbi:MAG TPA: DUF4331 family protein [Gemmatimonadaceae bacterium]|nr:DUF4331 family protein [Gemmatimonadaceae bacterium]
MLWKPALRSLVACAALGYLVTACDSGADRALTAPDASQADHLYGDAVDADMVYDQVDFLGNPLVSEVTIVKANHDQYNRTQPYATATFRPQTEAFVTSFNRPQALASLLGSVLYPDILVVDATKSPSTAGWLSWALAGGYGGRKLTDDVVDVGLTAIFSSFLNPTNAYCAPFQLPLCTDNVGANDRAFGTTFPYLAAPHS